LIRTARINLKSDRFKFYYKGEELIAKPEEELKDIEVDYKDMVEVGYDSFKDFTDLQKCEGDWTEDVMQLVKFTIDDVIGAISTEIKDKFNNNEDQLSIMFTWIGVKALHELYPESKNKWKLIALKGIEALSRKGMIYNQMEFASLSFAQ
jgi:predicted acetyltransferase